MMKKLLTLIAGFVLISPLYALESGDFPPAINGITSYASPCVPIYSVDGITKVTGLDAATTDFIISLRTGGGGTAQEFEDVADIETISAIDTWVSPTQTSDIRMGECGIAGTYQFQIHDDYMDVSNSAAIELCVADGASTILDQCAIIDQNVLSAANIESEVNDALVALHLDHLFAVALADVAVNDSAWCEMLASDADCSGYAQSTDALEALQGAIGTAQLDLNIITGSDGTTLATTQGNYAPATVAALTTAQNDLNTITSSGGVFLDAAGLNADAVAEIEDGVLDADMTTHQTLGTLGQAIGDPLANAETMYDAVVTDAAGTNVAIDIIAVKTETALIVADTGTDGVPLTAAAVNLIWDEVIETLGTTYTARCILNAAFAILAGEASDSYKTFKDPGGNANRVVAGTLSATARSSITITCP